jgi:hypothetical protein
MARGYRVSPFCSPLITIDYMIRQLLQFKRKDAMRRFYNTVLGEPYNDSNARITEESIRAVMHGSTKVSISGEPVFIGIDAGITCHIVLIHVGGKKPVAFEWRQVLADNLVNEVERILEEFNVIGGVMDRNPYTPLANEIRDMSHGRIMPTEYAGSPTAPGLQIIKDELDNLSHIRANRTNMIDAVATVIKKRNIDFVGYTNQESLIIQHLRDMVRIEKDDQTAVWQKLNGDDHYFHALGYALFALRSNDAILYKSDMDVRNFADVFGLSLMQQNDAELNMQSYRKSTISLGII